MEILVIIVKWFGYVFLALLLSAWVITSAVTRKPGLCLKWTFWCSADKLFGLLALAASPITSLFVDRHGNLKYGARWLQTPDSNMWGDPGDSGFYEDHVYDTAWWTALCWQWRNTAQGFSTWVLGLQGELIAELEWEAGADKLKKWLRLIYQTDGKLVGFEFKFSFKIPFAEKRVRFYAGWKWKWAKDKTDKYLPPQLVLSIGIHRIAEA